MPIERSIARLISAALVVGALFAVSPSDATSAVLLSRKELVAKSDLVVRATVIESVSEWNAENTAIEKRTRLRVVQTGKGKGKVDRELVLHQLGGTVGDKTMRVPGDAELADGEDVVLFLKRGEGGYVHLTALAQAAFHVRDGKAKRQLSGLSLFVWAGKKLVPTEPPNEAAEPVERLMADVARAARGAK